MNETKNINIKINSLLEEAFQNDKSIPFSKILDLELDKTSDYDKIIFTLQENNIKINFDIENENTTNYIDINNELKYESDAFKSYAKNISAYKILSRDEERMLLEQYKIYGNKKAREKLINCNLRLVVSIARAYLYGLKNIELIDLVEEGNIGLIKGIENYDIKYNFKLSTYVTWYIKSSILAALKNSDIIRKPNYGIQIIKEYNDYVNECNNLNKKIDIKFFAEKSHVSIYTLMELLKYSNDYISLDTNISQNKETVYYEILEDPSSKFEDKVINRVIIDQLKENLTELEFEIIKMRNGLYENIPKTYAEIGKMLGYTPEGVRFIHNRAMCKMKKIKDNTR